MKNLSTLLVCFLCFQIAAEKPWRFKTTLGVNLGQNFNQSFLGLQNGVSFSPGFQLEEVIRWYNLPHEWRTEFVLNESWSLTMPQTVFVKSSDSLHFKSSYLYHVVDWFGPYVSAKLRTSVFPGSDVETGPTTYTITDAATGVVTTPPASTGSNGTYSFNLTSAFLPLILEQDIGVFAQPYHEDELLLEFRAGATARENIAKNQRILTAVGVIYDNTPVRQLDNVYELGPSLGMHFKADLWEKKLSYRLSCDALWSLFQTPQESLAATHGLSFDLSTGLGVNILSWLGVHWHFKAILNPAILDRVQLMSHLMLAVNFNH